jgi:hypothetical protein
MQAIGPIEYEVHMACDCEDDSCAGKKLSPETQCVGCVIVTPEAFVAGPLEQNIIDARRQDRCANPSIHSP